MVDQGAPPVPGESPFKGKRGLARIIHAFFNSLAGLADAWRHESAFRQEILLATVLVPVACLVRVTPVDQFLYSAHVEVVACFKR